MPRMSVCIPTYKGDKTLPETLESVRNQSFKDYDVVMEEDLKGNGLANSLNVLVRKATGDILVFLAQDDILLPNALQLIDDEFKNDKDISVVVRPYYWFEKDWKKPIRRTKYINPNPESHFFLCGQLSGIAVKRDCFINPFIPKRFVEFASGIIPILKKYSYVVIEKPTVAIRITSSDSMSKACYEESPTENWFSVFVKNFSDNIEFLHYLNDKLATNFVGLVQVRLYGGWKKMVKEIRIMLGLYPLIIFNYKLWFYLVVLSLPNFIVKGIRNLIIFRRLK